MTTQDKKLEMVRIALNNALNEPQLLKTLGQYGYGVERLQEGLALYQSAQVLTQSYSDARQNKVAANSRFQQHWLDAQFHYHHDLRAARLALKRKGETRYFLQLKGKRNRSFDGWHEQAQGFYLGLRDKPELQSLVGDAGVTAERLARGLQFLHLLAEDRLLVYTQRGSEVDSQRRRDEASAALDTWMATFRKIARAALVNAPEHLARLGLEAKPRRKRKRDGEQSEITVKSEPVVKRETAAVIVN